MYRQGDVALVPVKRLPGEAQALPGSRRGVVLAEGEVTGHAHVVEGPDVALYGGSDEVDRWLRVRSASAVLTHQEHGQIALPAGDYRVVIQREYSPEAVRQVAD